MKADRVPTFPGVPIALASAVLFGATTPAAKVFLGTIEPLLLSGLLYLGAGVGLAALRLTQHLAGRKFSAGLLRRHHLPWLIPVVIFGGMLGPVLMMFGLSLTTASHASLLLNVEGVATMAIAWIIFRENVDRRLLVGAGAIVAGAIALSWSSEGFALNLGGLLVVGACLCWAIDNSLSRQLADADPTAVAMIKGLGAGSTTTILAVFTGAQMPAVSVVAAAGVLGFSGVGLSLVLFLTALRYLGTARTGAYFSLAPFVGALIAASMGDPITIQLLVSACLMGIGVWLHLTERHAHWHEHEAVEHEHPHVHDAHHQHPHAGPVTEPHSHWHRHEPLGHRHPHYPDLHHRHAHKV